MQLKGPTINMDNLEKAITKANELIDKLKLIKSLENELHDEISKLEITISFSEITADI